MGYNPILHFAGGWDDDEDSKVDGPEGGGTDDAAEGQADDPVPS